MAGTGGTTDTDITYPALGSGPGGAVEARFGAGLRLIRVQLSHLPVPAWGAARAQLADTHTNVQWAYGPHSGLRHGEARASGPAVRFSCRAEGGNRVVYVGIQGTDRTIEWTTLDRCRLTDEGIAVRRATGSAAVVVFTLAPGSVAFTVTDEETAPDGPARRLYQTHVQSTGSAVIRARVSPPLGRAAPCPPASRPGRHTASPSPRGPGRRGLARKG